MSRDPRRYVVIEGDALMRLPSSSLDSKEMVRLIIILLVVFHCATDTKRWKITRYTYDIRIYVITHDTYKSNKFYSFEITKLFVHYCLSVCLD